jgi:hypothetical protein
MTSTKENQSTFDFVATWLRQADPILSGTKPLSVLLGKHSLPSSAEAFQLASKPKSRKDLLATLFYNKRPRLPIPIQPSLTAMVAVPFGAEDGIR